MGYLWAQKIVLGLGLEDLSSASASASAVGLKGLSSFNIIALYLVTQYYTVSKTRKPCCRRESARCRCNFRSIDQDMINEDQWRTDFKLSYVNYLLNL